MCPKAREGLFINYFQRSSQRSAGCRPDLVKNR
jgi:hypothetical protein